MASTIPVSNSRYGDRSRSGRMGALMDLSRGGPPLAAAIRPAPRRETERKPTTAPAASQIRSQPSRLPQNQPARKVAGQTGTNSSRPPLTHETQSWSSTSIPVPPATMARAKDPPRAAKNVLRRKQSTMLKEPRSTHIRDQSRSDSGRTGSSSSIPKSSASLDPSTSFSDRSMTESPVEIRIAHKVDPYRPGVPPAKIYPELDRYRDIQVPQSRDDAGRDVLYRLATEDLPPPTPQFSGASSHSQLSIFSASPSTRFSESPGTGPYSRDTTPTSMSSQSPGFVAPMRLPAARVRQASPAETRPPVTRRRAGSTSNEGGSFSGDPQGLAAVREALTSSSSNSTVRAEERKERARRERMPAPNPPPRKSSQKIKKAQSTDETSSRLPRMPAQPVMRSPSPHKYMQSLHDRTPSNTSSPQLRPTVPSRPSRDGTPDLYSQFGGPVPVIQSNLSSTSLPDRRLSGQLQSTSLPRVATPSTGQERPSLGRPSLSQESSRAPRTGSSTTSRSETDKPTKPPSPVIPPTKSKFSLFSRKPKTNSEATQADKKKEKTTRKGPAAGTGHEGYGRVGAVKRRSSSTASSLQRSHPGPVSSSESLASTLSTDPFLLERMQPVIIAGGGVVENRNTSSDMYRTESNQSATQSRPSLDSRSASHVSLATRNEGRQTLWPSAIPRDRSHSRRPSDSSDSEAVMMKSTLAYRRSIRGLQSPDGTAFKMPLPISTRAPSAASMATTIYTDDSFPDLQTEQSYEPPQVSTTPKKLTKKPKSPRKWNLFGRSQASSSVAKKDIETTVSAAVQVSQSKSMPFYAIMDSPEQEDLEYGDDMSAILREAEVLPISIEPLQDDSRRPSTSSQRPKTTESAPAPKASQIRTPDLSSLAPQPWTTSPPKVIPQTHKSPPTAPVGRPSRLPQVGRIPKVITTRPEQTSPKSFSRPFNRISVHLPTDGTLQVDANSLGKGPSPPKLSPVNAIRTGSPQKPMRMRSPNASQDAPVTLELPNREFLTFPARKNSECTMSSDSSCSAVRGHADHTAKVPEPTAPLQEDEVWGEYDDLLEDAPPSPTSSCGVPFPLETYQSRLVKKSTKPLESPTIKMDHVQDVRDSVSTARTATTVTTSSHYSADMTARINAAFRFGTDAPATPFSVSEFVSGYGDRNNSKAQSEPAQEDPARNSSSSQRSEKPKAPSVRSSGSSRKSEETPLSQVNLRVGSMTVSKWLTFGHVLFSPVRDELINDDGSLKRQSILVVDGLGNDDWSFYAAETYPTANFFNLSPRAPLSQEHKSTSSFPLSPPNHHQIQFASQAEKFPFGPESFTAMVFRFPSAAPASHYRNIITEARRVLKPGGFIELSILDVDLNNMGNRTRRSVRHLKERVTAQNPDFNLSSTADIILRLLGKKGFVDIKTCRVGVPVCSVADATTKDGKRDERSLAEMMNDDTEAGDENITKMVSKVGRWWYNRCYEVPTGMKKSLWSDRALLSECEEWGTSLKLTVCHARMPESRGRVASI